MAQKASGVHLGRRGAAVRGVRASLSFAARCPLPMAVVVFVFRGRMHSDGARRAKLQQTRT